MNLILEFVIILGICYAGEIIFSFSPIYLPSSIISMILMLILLSCGILKEKHIKNLGDFFLKYMSLFFLPAAVKIIDYWQIIGDVLVPFILICAITLLLTFVSTAYTVIFVQKIQKKFFKRRKS